MNINAYLSARKKIIDTQIIKYLPSADRYTSTLVRAMRYSAVARSKRIRPILVLAACEAVGGSMKDAVPTACAIELIHTYTLVHDDLPAMDDDDWRRGKRSNHKVFGEDIAILAGDALNTLAFRIIADNTDKRPALKVISLLSGALLRVVGGQAADLKFEGKKFNKNDIEYIHKNKTAALIKASVLCGAVIGGADRRTINKLSRFGEDIGLAFQVIDDILDVTSNRKALGKTPKKDVRQKKATYPRLLGIQRSKDLASNKVDSSIKALQGLGKRFNMLRSLAVYLAGRAS